ncbi:zinc transporter 8-like [Punica granatum]|uniref:Uncharacterized protein n=2 Tax=Punica granatum TaxID=22663 RepID=A0A218XMK3_PUNGR|nr:zinc transporter 8-like [Punica granatum]OWM85711.1 hypothetical protein CDL15_Pgr029134 [Punica granatum]PKI71226.1 hypothetical protein CRG98_008401 [Punica granatum]
MNKPFTACFPLLLLLLLSAQSVTAAECTCESKPEGRDGSKALSYKLTAICSILIAGAMGVSLPILGKKIPALHPENTAFFLIKSFAAGVILATGFIHILPDAFGSLASPCLGVAPWKDFPFAGFVSMVSAIGTMMIDAFVTGYYKRSHFMKKVSGDEEMQGGHQGHVHVHTHASHGHAHGSAPVTERSSSSDLIRHRIVTQVLEMGIVVHSVIIGVSLGASESPDTIKPIIVALTFHQLFEGIGLGGCISQAKFESRAVAAMVLYFALTTPAGIAVGIGISKVYREDSREALIVGGVLNSASAGILIYMALVDLIAADYMSPRMLSDPRLQLGASLSLLLGSACMSFLAKWA